MHRSVQIFGRLLKLDDRTLRVYGELPSFSFSVVQNDETILKIHPKLTAQGAWDGTYSQFSEVALEIENAIVGIVGETYRGRVRSTLQPFAEEILWQLLQVYPRLLHEATEPLHREIMDLKSNASELAKRNRHLSAVATAVDPAKITEELVIASSSSEQLTWLRENGFRWYQSNDECGYRHEATDLRFKFDIVVGLPSVWSMEARFDLLDHQ